MKNVSNLFHHIHFENFDWLKSFVVSYRCFAWVYKRYHLQVKKDVWKKRWIFHCKHWAFCLSVQAFPLTVKKDVLFEKVFVLKNVWFEKCLICMWCYRWDTSSIEMIHVLSLRIIILLLIRGMLLRSQWVLVL